MSKTESSQLIVHLNRNHGSLNRLIGIVRQRGFEIESMNMQSNAKLPGNPATAFNYRIEMVVVSDRCIVHLTKKINQMVDVHSVMAAKLTTLATDQLVTCFDVASTT